MDNISQVDLLALAEWSNETKSQKLACITDPIAHNLVQHMLSKDPLVRPLTAAHVLEHPFFTGRSHPRLCNAVFRRLTRGQAHGSHVRSGAEVGLFYQLQSCC